MNVDLLRKEFLDHFGYLPTAVVSSPGRINLIGEHIDYNGGFVLPAAIDKKIIVAISPRDDKKIKLFAIDQPEKSFETELEHLQKSSLHWPNYILGVVEQCVRRESPLSGFDVAISGDVPIGAGVSSSAALECATLFALNHIFDLKMDRIQMARLAQAAENQFVGVNCGIMDQFASLMGKEGNVIKLDCATLQYEYYPFSPDEEVLVLFDTQVKHSLASSAYNQRRQECEEGLAAIRQTNPERQALSQATLEELDNAPLPATVRQRCKYVIEEQLRVNAACNDLVNGDLNSFGKKMFLTHWGLSSQYQVSCEELDFIVRACQTHSSVLGARLMGGGFGGCVIALLHKNSLARISMQLGEQYEAVFGKKMLVHQIGIGEGTSLQ